MPQQEESNPAEELNMENMDLFEYISNMNVPEQAPGAGAAKKLVSLASDPFDFDAFMTSLETSKPSNAQQN